MVKLDSEMSQWEKRIKAQGSAAPPKRMGCSPPEKAALTTKKKKLRRKGCNAPHTLKHSSELVKPKIDRALFGNPAGAKYKTKEPKDINTTRITQQYVDIWNASPFPKLREFKSIKDQEAGKQTKTYQVIIKLLRKLIKGTLYNGSEPTVRFPAGFYGQALRVPLERFQYLVNNLEKKAFNSDYLPRKKAWLAKTTLACFLVGNGQYGAIPSQLLEHSLTSAIPNTHTKPRDPKLAEVFRDLFLLKTDRPELFLTFAERNHLVGASNKYLEFFTRFKEPFEVYGYKDPIDFLGEYYWKAIDDSWPGRRIKKIPLGYLNSSALINKVIIPYFLKIGILKEYDFEGITKEYWR